MRLKSWYSGMSAHGLASGLVVCAPAGRSRAGSNGGRAPRASSSVSAMNIFTEIGRMASRAAAARRAPTSVRGSWSEACRGRSTSRSAPRRGRPSPRRWPGCRWRRRSALSSAPARATGQIRPARSSKAAVLGEGLAPAGPFLLYDAVAFGEARPRLVHVDVVGVVFHLGRAAADAGDAACRSSCRSAWRSPRPVSAGGTTAAPAPRCRATGRERPPRCACPEQERAVGVGSSR